MKRISLPVISHSQVRTFTDCARKWQLRYQVGLTPPSSTPLRVGSAVHEVLDGIARGVQPLDVFTSIRTDYAAQIARVHDHDLRQQMQYECETVIELVKGYMIHWQKPTLMEWTVNRVVESEIEFQVPLINPATQRRASTKINGRIDKIVELGDGRLAVMEHKTISESIEPGTPFFSRLRFDHQISLYVLAARTKGYDVQTVLYDLIRKPTIEPGMVAKVDENGVPIVLDRDHNRVFNKNGTPRQTSSKADGYELQRRHETTDEWAKRLAADIASRPEFYYARREVPRLTSELFDYQLDMFNQVANIRDAIKTNRFPRNTYACTNRGTCPFIDYCATGKVEFDRAPVGWTLEPKEYLSAPNALSTVIDQITQSRNLTPAAS